MLTKELLAVVRTWDAGPAEVVLGVVGCEGLAEIDGMTSVGWLDFGLHMRLSDAIRAQVGVDGNIQAWMSAFERVSQRPILSSFFAAMFRLSGSPGNVFKATPRVFRLLNRNLGLMTLELAGESNSARIDLVGYPATEYSIDCYAEGLLGSIRAVMERADEKGAVILDITDPATGHIGYSLTW